MLHINITWSKAYSAEPAPTALGAGDKIILPSSALKGLLAAAGNNSWNLPSPLTFELCHPHTRSIVYGGVKDFSGSGDTVQLPTWMFESLQLEHNAKVVITLCALPKGTWARLQPMTPEAANITDYRATLESHLRSHYNTMAKGQIVACRYRSQTYPFLVTDLKPESPVCITNTNLEVELEPLEQGVALQHHHHEKWTVSLDESVVHAIIEDEQYQYWDVYLKDHTVVEVQMTVGSGDVDLVVGGTCERPKIDHHEWSDLSADTCRNLVISYPSSKMICIGIHAVSSDAVVSWKVGPVEGSEMDAIENGRLAHEAGYTQCKDCHTWVPERSSVLHETCCTGNNVICPYGCGRVFKEGSPEFDNHWHCTKCDYIGTQDGENKHNQYFHAPKTCICGDFVTDSYKELAHHRRTSCSERLIRCRYCQHVVPQGTQSSDPQDRLLNLHSHESYCGSRTITCQICKKQIPIKDIQVHAKVHDVQCRYCFGPSWVTDDDRKNAKLLQRVARKLDFQLEKRHKISDMIPEILDIIGEFAGTYFLLAVSRKPSSRQFLRDGGIGAILEQVLETGGDIRMLFSIREMYPDPEIPIIKAVYTKDPLLARRVCTIWDSWYSNIGYTISYNTSFTWGIENLQTDEKTKIHFERLRNGRSFVPIQVSNDEESDEESGEESEDEDPNPYIRTTSQERMDLTTSGQVTDVNYIVCELMANFLSQIEELRKFIEFNGIEHMHKIRGRISIKGPSEHAIWLISLCVDLGYKGLRHTGPDRSHIEPGIIHYVYPSLYDPDVACYMYFNNA